MRNLILWLTLLLIFNGQEALSQDDDDYTLDLRREVITVIGLDSGYVSHVEYYGKTGENGGKAYVYKNGVSEIDELKVGYFKKRNQLKNIRRLKVEDLSFTSGFWSDERIYVFDLPEEKQFKYEYLEKNRALPFLSILRFGVYDADTQIYIVNVPLNLNLKYLVENTASLATFEQKITTYDDHTEYFFKGISDSTSKIDYGAKEQSADLLTLKSDPFPSIRLIVTPKEYLGKEEQYLNEWITNLVAPSEKMNSQTKKTIDETIGDTKDRDSVIEILYNTVKSKIRYINIYTGLGGIQPHEVDYILTQKQGDCKDMANLMCQSLRHAGIEADLAISASLTHRFNMDFPALCSGNHMICVAKDNAGRILFLDPTEREGVYYNPSRQIQGTRVFVIGEGNGYFLDVPVISSDKNKTLLRYDLSVDDKKLVGNFSYEFNAIGALQIKTWYNEYGTDRFKAILTSYLKRITPRINYFDYEVDNNENSITISGKVEVPKSAYTLVGDKKYLLINFLPLPHPFGNIVKDSTNYITFSTINTQMDLYLYTGSPIEEVNDLDIRSEEGPLSFKIQATSEDQVLHINYKYNYDEIEINKNFSAKFIQFDKSIKDNFGKVVIFQ